MLWTDVTRGFAWLSRWRSTHERFVLCRPCGGLNDLLCQVQACWTYAERHERTLVVDIGFAGLGGDFADFFVPSRPSPAVRFDASTVALPVDATVVPNTIRGRLHHYSAKYSPEKWNYVDVDSSTKLTFDFQRKYRATILLHHQCGGGTDSFELLPRIGLSDEVRTAALECLAKLPEDYSAVHVRNTDYRTDYIEFFRRISPEVADRTLLVCSDDSEVIRAARRFFSNRVITASDIADTGGKPLHQIKTFSTHERRKEFINAIVDLVALGSAASLFTTSVRSGQISGFSSLAQYLHRNSGLLSSLLRIDKAP